MIANFIQTNCISIIWLILAILFFIMALKEWVKSRKNMKSLETIQTQPIGTVNILGVDFDGMLKIFKTELNNSNRESHKIVAISYLLAGLAALFSFVISLL